MIHTFTESGQGHVNEDALGHRQHPRDASLTLCALADGQGGQPGGGPAARIAVGAVLDAATEAEPRALLDPFAWPDLCGIADRRVAADIEAGYCTLVALAVWGEWIKTNC